jgi:hypothetical protein
VSDDDTEEKRAARRVILARRASFIAAAVAGVGIACGKEPTPPPQPCLSVPIDRDAAAPPEPCLAVSPRAYDPEVNDAGAPGPVDAAPEPTARPQPCLTPVRPPKPPPAPKK